MSDQVNVKRLAAAPNFSGRTALVTGAGKGLGRASALALRAELGVGARHTDGDTVESPEREREAAQRASLPLLTPEKTVYRSTGSTQ